MTMGSFPFLDYFSFIHILTVVLALVIIYLLLDGNRSNGSGRRNSINQKIMLAEKPTFSDTSSTKLSSISTYDKDNSAVNAVLEVRSKEDNSPDDQSKSSCIEQSEEAVLRRNEVVVRGPVRSLQECLRIFKLKDEGPEALSDDEIILLVQANHIQPRNLEKDLKNFQRGVIIRRKLLQQKVGIAEELMYQNYDYSKVFGACCENVVGYVGVPVGVAGPLVMDDKEYHVPMATTEGCLVASTNRGCRATALAGGIRTRVVFDAMSRGPVVRFTSAMRAIDALKWLEVPVNFNKLKKEFDESSRFARLLSVQARAAGRYVFIRFSAKTGDAMGMNMVSKGTEIALKSMQNQFPDMQILSLSGNYCTDKKPAALNWLEGRGKSVIAEAVLPAKVIQSVLKTSVPAIVELNVAKNLVGSAMAGSIGGFNAHASNVVSAIFIATGQDPAQNICSSNCITLMEPEGDQGQDLYISCTMPSIEVGTIGGGTGLPSQAACLKMLGVDGPHMTQPGQNARTLASIVCATVLAGELSLMAALAGGHLVTSHLRYNRSDTNIAASSLAAQRNSNNLQNSLPNITISTKVQHASSKQQQQQDEKQVTMNVIDLPTECKQS